jgi:uncharacterized protein YqeY
MHWHKCMLALQHQKLESIMASNTQILDSLTSKSKELRKSHDPLGLFLSSIISAAQDLAKGDTKNGITPPLNDDYAMRAIRGSIKQQDDVLAILLQREHSDNAINALVVKKNLLQSLLPSQPSEQDLLNESAAFIQTLTLSNPKQAIGPTIKHLTEKYGASLDKALASKVVQQIIAT